MKSHTIHLTMNVPARDPFVIHCFVPVIDQPSPVGSAVVRSDPASEPELDSVRANAPICSPRASGGTNRDFCSSVPKARIGNVVALVCTATVTPTPASARELLEHEDVRHEVRTGSSVLLGDADAHEAQLRELREELVRETVLAVPGSCVRDDLRLGKLVRQRLDRTLVDGEVEVHRPDYRNSPRAERLRQSEGSSRS